MDAASAYRLGQAITDTRQAARQLWKVMLSHGRGSAWFVLGYWQKKQPSAQDVDQTFAAIQEHMAYMAYEGFRYRTDEAWADWLLYAPVAELRRGAVNA